LAEGGANAADVALMRGVVGLKIGVKAAGGIRTAAHLFEMVDAGASRIGTSASVQIMRELGAE
jgi:deoxyribose-phosphate aldolase